jgi:hypothetical protein
MPRKALGAQGARQGAAVNLFYLGWMAGIWTVVLATWLAL